MPAQLPGTIFKKCDRRFHSPKPSGPKQTFNKHCAAGTCQHTCDAPTKCQHAWTLRYTVNGKQAERSFKDEVGGNGKVNLGSGRRLAQDAQVKLAHDIREQGHTFIDHTRASKENFGALAEAWLAALPRSEQTKLVYGNVLKVWVLPAFEGKTLAQVAQDRDGVIHLVSATMKGKNGKLLSRIRRAKALYIVQAVLDEAVAAGKLQSHRLAGIELADYGTTNDHSDFVFPSHSQIAQLAEGMNGHGLAIWLMRGCGLRQAEVMAVKTADFRDGGKTLRVSEQVLRSGKVGPLKARKAGEFRDIPVPGYLWTMVKDLPDGYLFIRNGRFLTYSSFLSTFKHHAAKAGIPNGFTPHSLRHAFASALLTRGVAITDVAQWLGHRDIRITFGTYGHLVPSAAARAVSVLDAEYKDWSHDDVRLANSAPEANRLL